MTKSLYIQNHHFQDFDKYNIALARHEATPFHYLACMYLREACVELIIHIIYRTWHTSGYPQSDLNTVNGGLSDIEVGVRTAGDHATQDLSLKWEVSGWLILIRVSLVCLEQLEQGTHCSLPL